MKRRNFEYLLKSRSPKKADYLRAIAYELNFEALRKKRKERLGLYFFQREDYTFKFFM